MTIKEWPGMTGVELIAAERQRQLEQEGWTPEHDDAHRPGELSLAAHCYAGHAALTLLGKGDGMVPRAWPWDDDWWKPKDALRDLVRAGALIAAEIDRMQRCAGKSNNPLPRCPQCGHPT